MMVSPEFVVEGKNREELEKTRQEINNQISDYLKDNIPEE